MNQNKQTDNQNQPNSQVKAKKNYAKPSVVKYGNVVALTRGQAGSKCDGSSTMNDMVSCP